MTKRAVVMSSVRLNPHLYAHRRVRNCLPTRSRAQMCFQHLLPPPTGSLNSLNSLSHKITVRQLWLSSSPSYGKGSSEKQSNLPKVISKWQRHILLFSWKLWPIALSVGVARDLKEVNFKSHAILIHFILHLITNVDSGLLIGQGRYRLLAGHCLP